MVTATERESPASAGALRASASAGPGGRRAALLGAAALVSVGYIDPGNWATDLEGGARFGFQLLWVLVGSGLIAILLQTSSARLGMATGLDLAEACRSYYPENIRIPLWLLAETGIVACDLAEVIGSAVALQLLVGLPLVVGALLTAADALVILALQRHGPRSIELLVTALVGIIGVSLGIQVWLAGPAWPAVASGLVPRLPKDGLYLAMGILGATIMPHNLYLHSALVAREATASGGRTVGSRQIWLSTVFALAVALVLNGAILVVAAAVFFTRSLPVTDLRDAHHLLAPLLGSGSAAALFAVALLCSGQSSTLTGTLAGQIVMEGFVRLRLPPVQRRALTRGLAIIPAVVVLSVAGEAGAMPLLVASQVLLSLQLPFAIIPLVRFTSSRAIMGRFVNPIGIRILTGLCAALVSAANGVLVARLISTCAPSVPFAVPLTVALASGAFLLLGYVSACSLRIPGNGTHALLVPPS